MRINTNIAALNTYNQYTVNNNAAAKSVEKLSSGLRINSAADDAAGLAISEKMRSQIRGLSQSSRNAQDGISMVQTAEGALDETEQILQRMRELSVEAANDTYTDDDKEAIQSEIDQLVQEIDRISTDTEFNNKKLLNGSLETKSTVGATNDAQISNVKIADDSLKTGTYTIEVTNVSTTYEVGDVNDTGLGSVAAVTDTVTAGTTSSGLAAVTTGDGELAGGEYTVELTATGTADEYTITLKDLDGNTIAEKNAVIDNATADVSVEIGGVSLTWDDVSGGGDAVAEGSDTILVGGTKPGQYTIELESTGNTDEYTITLRDKDGNTVAEKTDTLNNSSAAATTEVGGISLSWGTTDTIAEGESVIDIETDATFTLKSSTGNTLAGVTVKDNTTGEVTVGGLTLSFDDTLTETAAGESTEVSVINNSVSFQIGANAFQTMSVAVDEMSSKSLGVEDVDVTTTAGASSAIESIDSAINAVSAQRAKLGAVQNRLEHTINNLTTSEENLTAAESRIRDVDIAKEMMTYTTKNILQQTAQSMLAQANQQPQNVLSLLK